MAKPFRKMHALNDRVLVGALSNHQQVLQQMGEALTRLWRERRLLLVLHAVEVGTIIYLVTR